MKTKATFLARNAPMVTGFGAGSPHVQDTVLPMASIRANLSVNKQVIGWMSA